MDAEPVEKLEREAVAALVEAGEREDLVRAVIESFLRQGYGMGMTAGELVDSFCVSTPNIIESATRSDSWGDHLAELFDEIHDNVRRDLAR